GGAGRRVRPAGEGHRRAVDEELEGGVAAHAEAARHELSEVAHAVCAQIDLDQLSLRRRVESAPDGRAGGDGGEPRRIEAATADEARFGAGISAPDDRSAVTAGVLRAQLQRRGALVDAAANPDDHAAWRSTRRDDLSNG